MDNHYQLSSYSLIKPTLLSNTNWEKSKEYELSGPTNLEFYIRPKHSSPVAGSNTNFIKFYEDAMESYTKDQYKILIESTYHALASLINIRNQIPSNIELINYDTWDMQLKKKLGSMFVRFASDYGLLGILPHILFKFPMNSIRINDYFENIKIDTPIITLANDKDKVIKIQLCLSRKIETTSSISKVIDSFFPNSKQFQRPTLLECIENTAIYTTQYSEPLFLVLLAIDRLYSVLFKGTSETDEDIQIDTARLNYCYDSITKQNIIKTSFNSLYDLLLYTAMLLKSSTSHKIVICKECNLAVVRSKKAENYCAACKETVRKREYRSLKNK